ncbi:MAG TPA: efflux transporter outer membrane subunit [Rhodocyclaceae bacterium]|nr:efflux transporter outer membrane subunit [Rhodocyclaceae bacterium]
MKYRNALTPIALTLLLSGCFTVGPDYAGAPELANAKPGALTRANQTGVKSEAPIAAAWWQSLGDDTLNSLVAQALADSPDMQAAQARLRKARATLGREEANGRPKVGATGLGLGTLVGPGTAEEHGSEFYFVGFDASWEIDFAGGKQRALEAAGAQRGEVLASFADAQVSLAAEVVQAYTELRGRQQRLALLRETAQLDEQTLALTRQQEARGVASAMDVERLVSRLEVSRRNVQETEGAISETLDRLAVLCGQAPGTLDTRLSPDVQLPKVPNEVAVGDVGSLLKQRPDIRAAERRLAASTARIGQQKSNYFPKVTITGMIGTGGDSPSKLGDAGSLTLLAVPQIKWGFLDFGRTKAAVQEAEAGRDEAHASYEASVLNALRDANVALTRFGHQRQSLASLQQQQASAERNLGLVTQRQRAGAATLLEQQDAQRAAVNARQEVTAAQAKLLQDFTALHKSLGLGWGTNPSAAS